MSRLTLLAINAKYIHTSLAVRVLANGIRKYARLPHEVSIFEIPLSKAAGADSGIAGMIADTKPDVVGISVYIWNAKILPELLSALRERLPDAIFVLGGPEAAYNAEYWLEQGADYVLPGEGEYSLPPLLDAIEDQFPDAISATPNYEREYEPIDPYPDDDNAYEQGAADGRILYLETSRGCPYKCAFCLSAGSGVRFFPIETVERWLEKFSKHDVKTIKLVDRTFNCDPARAYRLFEFVIGLETKCCFHFEVAADLFDERTIALLGTSPPGRIQFEAGLQSFYEPALKAASRHMDIDKAVENIRALLSGRNIHIHIDLIAGLPFETLQETMNSFDRAYALGAHTLQLGFLKLLHGSELRKRAEEFGIKYQTFPPYEIECSPWLSAQDIETLKHAENALSRTYNESRFLSTLEYVLSASRLRPFELFRMLGAVAGNHGTALTAYAEQIYNVFTEIPGVEDPVLKDHMICDWLRMVKGENLPDVLKNKDVRRARVTAEAKKKLGDIRRDAAAVLNSGKGVYIDAGDRDPVTGLYRIYVIENIAE